MAIEIAEAVVGALDGELSATAVNAPMVPPEVRRPILLLERFSKSHRGLFPAPNMRIVMLAGSL